MKLLDLALTISLIAPLAAAASLGARQMDDALPDCFRICFAQAVTNNKGCALDDIGCFCAQEPLIAALSACVQDTCKGDDLQRSVEYGVAFCASGGVAITPSLSSTPEPTATMIADSSDMLGGPSSVATTTEGASTTGEASMSNIVPAESSAVVPQTTGTSSSVAPTSSSSVSATNVSSTKSSASSTVAPSAAASATQSGAASGLITPHTGLLAGLLAVALAL